MEKKQFDTCPKCGHHVEGEISKSSLQELEAGIGLTGMAIGTAVGAILGDYSRGMKIGKNIASMTSGYTADKLNLNADYEFCCPECGNRWTKKIQVNADTIPDEVMENRRLEMIDYCESKSHKKVVWAIVFSVLALICWIYCLSNDMSTQRAAHDPLFGVDFTATDYNFTWLFLGLVMIVAIIGAIIDGIVLHEGINGNKKSIKTE
jgi:predicted RNA-binding Zn-ribbon protein involved in translation (DUF1610 family)